MCQVRPILTHPGLQFDHFLDVRQYFYPDMDKFKKNMSTEAERLKSFFVNWDKEMERFAVQLATAGFHNVTTLKGGCVAHWEGKGGRGPVPEIRSSWKIVTTLGRQVGEEERSSSFSHLSCRFTVCFLLLQSADCAAIIHTWENGAWLSVSAVDCSCAGRVTTKSSQHWFSMLCMARAVPFC